MWKVQGFTLLQFFSTIGTMSTATEIQLTVRTVQYDWSKKYQKIYIERKKLGIIWQWQKKSKKHGIKNLFILAELFSKSDCTALIRVGRFSVLKFNMLLLISDQVMLDWLLKYVFLSFFCCVLAKVSIDFPSILLNVACWMSKFAKIA